MTASSPMSSDDCDSLKKSIDGLAELIKQLLARLQQPPVPHQQTTSSEMKAAVASVLADRESLDGKSTRAVLVNVPESESEEETVSHDKAILLKIFREINNPRLTDILPVIRFHRHPEMRREGTTTPRIIKIQFDTPCSRNLFLSEAIRVKAGRLTGSDRAYIRPDYTMDQLKLERSLKKQAYERNLEFGRIRFVVRNLEIIQLREDRELPSGMREASDKRKSERECISGNLSGLTFDPNQLASTIFSLVNQYQSNAARGRPVNRGRGGRGGGVSRSTNRGGSQSQSQSQQRTRTRKSTGGLPGEPAAKAAHPSSSTSHSLLPPTSTPVVHLDETLTPNKLSPTPLASSTPKTHSLMG